MRQRHNFIGTIIFITPMTIMLLLFAILVTSQLQVAAANDSANGNPPAQAASSENDAAKVQAVKAQTYAKAQAAKAQAAKSQTAKAQAAKIQAAKVQAAKAQAADAREANAKAKESQASQAQVSTPAAGTQSTNSHTTPPHAANSHTANFHTATSSPPATSQTVSPQAVSSQASMSQPAVSQPVSTSAARPQPRTSQPAVSQPVSSSASTPQPRTSQPAISQPASSTTSTPQPRTSQPKTSQQARSSSSTTAAIRKPVAAKPHINRPPARLRNAHSQASTAEVKEPAALENAPRKTYQSFKLVDEKGAAIFPSAIVQIEKSFYLLGGDCLYFLPELAGGTAQEEKPLTVQTLPVPGNKVGGIPIQEFLQLTFWPKHNSVVVLDKSGSVFEYVPSRRKWELVWANKQTLGSPDPHYVAISSDGPHLLMLDPERNQIWRFPPTGKGDRYFKDVLPWRIHAGDPNVSDGIAIGFDGSTYVLRRSGNVSIYPATAAGGNGNPRRLNWNPPVGIAPSRLSVAPHSPLYVTERENSRILAIDKTTGKTEKFLFPAKSDLRGVLPGYGGFCVIDGSNLDFRMLGQNDNQSKLTPRNFDWRLSILHIPIKGGSLPHHPGVFPGARRLYRHGVHQGLDFFHDPGGGTKVMVNTPAIAAAAGTVIRTDVNYHDMDARQYAKIMQDCARDQYCSDENEDLFRGCQVWIDHGNGLVTRYAHLNKARSDLRVGMPVDAGEIVGYIGYSGTGENQPGKVKHPHLHFEVWLDGHYLGYALTPSETFVLYQKIFAKRGH